MADTHTLMAFVENAAKSTTQSGEDYIQTPVNAALKNTALENPQDSEQDNYTIFVAPGIDTIHGPVVISELTDLESVHIIVAEATETDTVTARLSSTGSDVEVVYRQEVVAILIGKTTLRPNQVIFAPMTLVDASDRKSNQASNSFVWDGYDRKALQRKPIPVADFTSGIDKLIVNLNFGPSNPVIRFEETVDGDTFVRVNGKALFRLVGATADQVDTSDIQINRL